MADQTGNLHRRVPGERSARSSTRGESRTTPCRLRCCHVTGYDVGW